MSGILRWIIGPAARPPVVLAAAALLVLSSACSGPRYSDDSFYGDVAWGIMQGVGTIYNQNVVGTPVGAIDATAGGPYGQGTVHITGTTSYDSGTGIETAHLQYDLTNCRISATSSSSNLNVDLTLDGVINEDGSWSTATTYVSLSYNSASLRVSGSSERDSRQRDVNGTTSYHAERTTSGTSAELFGHDVTW
ncbi:MAG TPA: hypothetical protein VMH22_07320 [bacterium]|nr:hypothetical protein [bacterium]